MRHAHTDMRPASTDRRRMPHGLVAWGHVVDFRTGPIRDASKAGDYGRVIELSRRGRQMPQAALGQALGLSQSAISRLEKRGSASYSTDVLTAAAAHLQIPPALVGLADGRPAQVQARDDDPMHRRTVLGGAVAAMAAPSCPPRQTRATRPAGRPPRCG
ncbi:helix-turn-helix transcriptional regulator [Streptomyces sp. NPDC006393]|uniref:helix-turn-helix domain-containing protein n=1 Tax=Streptomyces sp. NPDC006393 TaxID=3156763 RepID=UPI0033CC69BC